MVLLKVAKMLQWTLFIRNINDNILNYIGPLSQAMLYRRPQMNGHFSLLFGMQLYRLFALCHSNSMCAISLRWFFLSSQEIRRSNTMRIFSRAIVPVRFSSLHIWLCIKCTMYMCTNWTETWNEMSCRCERSYLCSELNLAKDKHI